MQVDLSCWKSRLGNDLGLSLERMVEAELCRNQLLRGAGEGVCLILCIKVAKSPETFAHHDMFAGTLYYWYTFWLHFKLIVCSSLMRSPRKCWQGLRSLGFEKDADCNAGDWHIATFQNLWFLYVSFAKDWIFFIFFSQSEPARRLSPSGIVLRSALLLWLDFILRSQGWSDRRQSLQQPDLKPNERLNANMNSDFFQSFWCGRACGNQFWGPFLQVGLVGKRTPLPLDKCKESLGGAIQIDSDAREVRYWLDQQEASSGSRQRAFLHPSSLLFKASLMVAVIGGSMVEIIGNPCVPVEKT